MAFAGLLALAVLVLGILWGPLGAVSRTGMDRFRPRPEGEPEVAVRNAEANR